MLTLSIRQPYAELILRGIKTAEFRSRSTRIIGERFWIYATKGTDARQAARPVRRARRTNPHPTSNAFSADLQLAPPPPWMIDLANALKLFGPDVQLPRGMIVGSAVIDRVEEIPSAEATGPDRLIPPNRLWAWHLTDVKRLTTPRRPKGHPQPVWWRAA